MSDAIADVVQRIILVGTTHAQIFASAASASQKESCLAKPLFVDPIAEARSADPVRHLAALRPALLLLDIDHLGFDGAPFILAVKNSPATRQVPIVAFGTNGTRLAEIKRAGCDHAALLKDTDINPDPLAAWLEPIVRQYARPDDRAELLRQSQLPLPALAHAAIEQFNAREFFEQHETFETLWRAESGPIRRLYQGILQIGVAYLQIQRKNYAGASKLFLRAQQYLADLPAICQTINVAQFRVDSDAAQAELERLGPAHIAEFDPLWFKPILTHTD